MLSVGGASLPYPLQKRIQEYLSEAEDLDEDTGLQFSLSNQDSVQEQHRIHPFPRTSITSKASEKFLAFLDDLGCSRYPRIELIQIAPLEPPNCFVSWINGMLIYEIKFPHSLPSYELL